MRRNNYIALQQQYHKDEQLQMQNMNAMQQLATPTPEPMAMTFFEMTRPTPEKLGFTKKLFGTFFQKLDAGTKVVQYGKMVQAMSSLTDEQLAQIGITRADIQRYSHYCIYQD